MTAEVVAKVQPVFTAAEVDEQAKRAYQLRLMGFTQDRIARDLGVAQSTVHKRLERGSMLAVAPLVNEFRAQSDARLAFYAESLIARHTVDGTKVYLDAKAVEALVKVEERRARLVGADMPVLIEQKVTVTGPVEDELAELSASLVIINEEGERVT